MDEVESVVEWWRVFSPQFCGVENGHVEMETSYDFREVLVRISMIISLYAYMTTDGNIIGPLYPL